MIARLRGVLASGSWDYLVVDVHGVGYRVQVPLSTRDRLPVEGEEITLLVHTHVREEVIALYGFATDEEMALFEEVIEVSGVGPRLALTILSTFPPGEFRRAVSDENLDVLTRIPGVGKKTARRLVLELRDRLGTVPAPAGSGATAPAGVDTDAVAALVSLGYDPAEATGAVRRALEAQGAGQNGADDVAGLVKAALQHVGRRD